MKVVGRGTTEFLLEDLSSGRQGEFRESLSLYLLFFKGRAQLSDFTFTFRFHASEKEMATHSSVLAWRIPETEEPSGLPSMGSHRVGHDRSDLAVAVAKQ